MESQISKNLAFGATERMARAEAGKVVLLTTRLPEYDKEEYRIVFGVYKIIEVRQKDSYLIGSADQAIRLSESDALALPYWKFKTFDGSGRPEWNYHLFRYISDQDVTNFLHSLGPRLKKPEERVVLDRLLGCCGNLNPSF